MASSTHVPRIIVLALGAGALGFPDALCVLLKIAGRRPLLDITICVFAMTVVTAHALGAILLARFVRKARGAGGDAPGAPPPPRTDRFAQVTLVVSLAVAFLVSACLLVASGAGAGAAGLGLLYLTAADVARKMKSPVIAALATGAAVLPCARPLLRVFRDEDHSHGTGRFASVAQVANFTGAAAFLLAVSGGVYTRRGSLLAVSAVVGSVLLLARFAFARSARNAAGAGGRAGPAPAADTRRFRKLTRLAPYLAVVAFAALIYWHVLTTAAPLESEVDGAKYT